MAEPIALTKETFDSFMQEATVPVLVDFWASWCGPCRMIAPYVETLAQELDGQLAVAKVNIDEEPDLATAYQVMSIPTLMVFENGKKADRLVGANAQALAQMVARALEK
ncbi:MAG: thioredoxin [Clostridia bacterium]|nr:thioredoxin [Clostridia bacterium]